MKGKELLKDKMTGEELAEVFKMNNPAFEANSNIVGRFAKKLGYKYVKQTKNHVTTYFYVRETE